MTEGGPRGGGVPLPSPSSEGFGLLLAAVLRGAPGNAPLCRALWDLVSSPPGWPARKKYGISPVPL